MRNAQRLLNFFLIRIQFKLDQQKSFVGRNKDDGYE